MRVAFRDNGGIAEIVQANSYGIWGEELPTLSYLKQTWKVDNFKFTGKESLEGTGFIDFGARWLDNIVPRFTTIDPLSELSRRFSPTVYGNNNPLRFIDPDGMMSRNAQKGFDDNDESRYVRDDPNMDKFNGIQGGDPPTASNINTATSYDKLGTGTNITSGIYSGTKLAEVTVKGRRPDAFDESIRTYGSGSYNRRYYPSNPNDANNYSPYNPDAVAFSMSFNASGYMWSGSIDVGFAMSTEGFAVFESETYGLGGQVPGIGIGGNFTMIDKYGGQKSVFDGMAGESIGGEANAFFSGGYSTSAQMINGAYGKSPNGVESISIGLRPSIGNWGARGTYSNTKFIKPLWQR